MEKEKSETEEFKETIANLLKDYIVVKKEAVGELGYNEDALKLKDYIDYYVRLSKDK